MTFPVPRISVWQEALCRWGQHVWRVLHKSHLTDPLLSQGVHRECETCGKMQCTALDCVCQGCKIEPKESP